MNIKIRPAAVSGMFYPAMPTVLIKEIEQLLANVKSIPAIKPKVLIVPHAGYMYSGSIAAMAYASLYDLRGLVNRVVLIGPAHKEFVEAVALPDCDAFETPLGPVAVDVSLAELVLDLPGVEKKELAHAREHSLEVQIPFLQVLLPEFSVLPVLVGHASSDLVANMLEKVWGGNETLIVVSSDLSHYLSYEQACKLDDKTIEKILTLDSEISQDQACGASPINGLLAYAKRKGLKPHLLGMCNSGDHSGDKKRVVGYASFAFEE